VDLEGAGVARVWAPWLPIELELRAVVRLALQAGEEATPEAHYFGPSMSIVQTLETPISGTPPAHHPEGFEVIVLHPLEFRFEATLGTHSIELYTDRNRESLFWMVHEGPPPEPFG